MDRIWLRTAQKLEYRDPASLLVSLRQLEGEVAASDLSDEERNLRTNSLKEWRELRDAALFCYGMGLHISQTVFVGRSEEQDYDFVARWTVDNELHFAPIQLKEVVPFGRDAKSLQMQVNALEKYVDSDNLTVAIRLNQQMRFDPSKLNIPKLRIAALWVFACTSPDRSQWGLWGNLLEAKTPEGLRYAYPT